MPSLAPRLHYRRAYATLKGDIMDHKRFEDDRDLGPAISILPIEESIGHVDAESLLELQLKMATSSINHEYARMEFDDVDCRARREELLDYMEDCRSEYLKARGELEHYDPYALAEFEADLLRQKLTTLTQYHA